VAIEWTDDPRAFADPAWRSLHERDPDATLFQSPDFLKPYWEELGGELRVAIVTGGGEPVAFAPFELVDGVLRFVGGTEVTDYQGPVAIPEAREAAAKELLAALPALEGWEVADLRGLPEDGAWLPVLSGAARDAGLAVEEHDDGVAPLLELPGSWDAYLDGLKGKLRHEIRRKDRRLREAFPDARLVDASADTLDADLDRFLAWHRASPGPKGSFMDPAMELFFRRLARALHPPGVFRQGGGRKLAGVIAFRSGTSLLLYNSAYDHDLAKLSPGMVLLSDLIRELIEAGCERLDMLKGDLEYKYRFGPRPRRVRRLRLARG
jgi:CelD/BcsL family acetyltransferase involved in cellulose biosynthesis